MICDEHIPYAVSDGLVRRGIDAVKVQRIGLRSAGDPAILEQAREARRVIYTNDRDFLRLAAADVRHPGILYHQANHYSVGTAIELVYEACCILSAGEMENNVYFA